MMDQIREFFFPVVVLGSWVVVAAYTLSSLGETPARVQCECARAAGVAHAQGAQEDEPPRPARLIWPGGVGLPRYGARLGRRGAEGPAR